MKVTENNRYQATAETIYSKFDTNTILIMVDNAGAGKSRSVGEFSNITRMNDERVMFATNTRKNRNDFQEHNKHFTIIKGDGEIINEIAGTTAEVVYSSYFDLSDEEQPQDKALELLKNNIITYGQLGSIREQIKENNDNLKNNQFVAVTVAKLQAGNTIKHAYNRFVFMDEMNLSKLFTSEQQFTIWDNDWVSEIDEDLNEFTKQLFRLAHSTQTQSQRINGVCLLSAEKSLARALQSDLAPVFKSKDYVVTVPQMLIDENLTTVTVKGTGNSHEASNRLLIADAFREKGYTVICDGQIKIKGHKRYGQQIGDYTIEGSKGRNDLKEQNIVTILSMPHPQETVNTMASLGYSKASFEYTPTYQAQLLIDQLNEWDELYSQRDLTQDENKERNRIKRELSELEEAETEKGLNNIHDIIQVEEDAIKLISSDKANQAIGRNTGHRSKGYKHILIVPTRIKDLELDTIGHVEDVSTKQGLDNCQNNIVSDVFQQLMNGTKYIVERAVQARITLLSSDKTVAVSASYLKRSIRQSLINKGVSDDRINRESIIKLVIEGLLSSGFVQVRLDNKLFNGSVIRCGSITNKRITDVIK